MISKTTTRLTSTTLFIPVLCEPVEPVVFVNIVRADDFFVSLRIRALVLITDVAPGWLSGTWAWRELLTCPMWRVSALARVPLSICSSKYTGITLSYGETLQVGIRLKIVILKSIFSQT